MILLVLLLTTSASLEDDAAFQRARDHYADLDFEKAREAFQEAEPATAEDNVTIFLWLGVCAAETLDFELARENFMLAITLDPDAVLPTRVSPKIEQAFAEAQAEAASIAMRADADASKSANATPGAAPDDGFSSDPEPAPERETRKRKRTIAVQPASRDDGTSKDAGVSGETDGLTIAAASFVITGIALAIGAAALLGVCAVAYAQASDRNTPQPDAETLYFIANGALYATGVVGAIAAGALVTGGILVAWGVSE